MAAEKLEELTIEQLKKKDKDIATSLLVCSIIFAICLLGMIYFKPIIAAIFLPLLLVILLPMANGRKKIREELKKRENAA